MELSHDIWIPSVRQFVRFKELKTSHQKQLSTLTKQDLDFIYVLNTLLAELCIDFSIENITTLDKFIICFYLRLHCIGSTLELNVTCPHCSHEFPFSLDLNDFITINNKVLDSDHSKFIESGNFSYYCNIPSIKHEYETLKYQTIKEINQNSIENLYTYYIYPYIHKIKVKDQLIDLDLLTIENKIDVLDTIKFTDITKIQNEFILPLIDIFNIKLINLHCIKYDCKLPIEHQFNINSINDIIKLLFAENPHGILKEIYFLSKYAKLDASYVESLTPIERNEMLKFLKEENKEQNERSNAAETMNSANLSNQGFQVESPSEFESW